MSEGTFEAWRLPSWLRLLLRAHQSGQPLPGGSVGGKPGISKAEAGMLLAGASRAEDAAFRLRYLGQESERPVILAALEDLQWSDHRDFGNVHCPDCLTRLLSLVVDEEIFPAQLNTTEARARYMGVSRGVWGRRYEKPHRHVRQQLEEWLSGAVRKACRNFYDRAA